MSRTKYCWGGNVAKDLHIALCCADFMSKTKNKKLLQSIVQTPLQPVVFCAVACELPIVIDFSIH